MNINDFGPFTLSASSHDNPADGMCIMEMVSFLAGEKWSDNPPCSSPVVSRFCQVINDRMGQGVRDKLQTYVPRLIGTASVQHDRERSEYLAWSAIRVFAPMALRSAGMEVQALRIESFSGSLSDARDVCLEVRRAAVASADEAADYSAYAAYAAADYAADYAAYADYAAAYAAYAASASASDAAVFRVLDGLLNIGPSGSNYTDGQSARIPDLAKAVVCA